MAALRELLRKVSLMFVQFWDSRSFQHFKSKTSLQQNRGAAGEKPDKVGTA